MLSDEIEPLCGIRWDWKIELPPHLNPLPPGERKKKGALPPGKKVEGDWGHRNKAPQKGIKKNWILKVLVKNFLPTEGSLIHAFYIGIEAK